MINESKCAHMDIHSRLTVATEIIDEVKRKLPNNLNGICIECRNNTYVENAINCSMFRNNFHVERPVDCSECTNSFSVAKPVDCNECRNFFRVAKPVDCNDIYQNGNLTSGQYEIWPQNRISRGPVAVYCDMDDDGGWTVIQRRGNYGNPEDYFYKDWNDYKIGFGNVLKEYWLGNDHIFAITNQKSYKLRVDLTDFQDNVKHAAYNAFWIEDESGNYTLHLGTYSGTAGDSLKIHNGSTFATKDRKDPNNCSITYRGAWWYNHCHHSNLNGPYLVNEVQTSISISWKHIKGNYYSLKHTVMKIKPTDST